MEILLCIAYVSSLALDSFDQNREALHNNVSQQPKVNVKQAVLLCVVYLFYGCTFMQINDELVLIIFIIIITISFIIATIIIFKVKLFTGKPMQDFPILFSLC